MNHQTVQDSWSRVFIDSRDKTSGPNGPAVPSNPRTNSPAGERRDRVGAEIPDRWSSPTIETSSNPVMSETPKKKAQTLLEWQKSRLKQQNPEMAKLVAQVEAEQDKDAGKQAVRGRHVVGGKVVYITLVGFEQSEMRGQWVPTMTFIKGSETTEQLVEEVESKGAELPPEQKSDKEETA